MKQICDYCETQFDDARYMYSENLCEKCSLSMSLCNHCNASNPLRDWQEYSCPSCGELESGENNAADGDILEREIAELKNIPLTTSFQFANQEIEIELGIVSAQCVFGMNIFRDVFASVRDAVGGRSKASEKVLKDLKDTCLAELKQDAFKLGADGVLSVSFDYQEFSGGGKSMLFLVATGTAVKFKEQST